MTKKELVDNILEKEWYFFSNTKDTEGIAECQTNKDEFIVMRKSQWINYDEKILNSYINDLERAYYENRNLVQEKYLYMMKNTEPVEFEKLKFILKEKSKGEEVLIKEIHKIYMEMGKEFYEKFPYFSNNLRPLYKSGDTVYRASVETYLYGELSSYSKLTLLYLLDYIKELKENDENILYLINNDVCKLKNMGSLEILEEYLKYTKKEVVK